MTPTVTEETKVKQNESLPECIIVDLDGTLAHINPDHIRTYYDANRAIHDLLDDAVSTIAAMAYNEDYKVIILSGRKQMHQKVAEAWLAKHNQPYDEIHFRKDTDHRPTEVIKEEMYRAYIQDKYQVKFVLEDWPECVEMWIDKGFKVLMPC